MNRPEQYWKLSYSFDIMDGQSPVRSRRRRRLEHDTVRNVNIPSPSPDEHVCPSPVSDILSARPIEVSTPVLNNLRADLRSYPSPAYSKPLAHVKSLVAVMEPPNGGTEHR